MQTRTDRRSIVVRYLAASILFLIIAVRFYSVDDQIGTLLYTFATAAALMMAFANLLRRD